MVALPASMGISWLLILLLGGTPLLQSPGLPPLPEDPVLAQVAPESCLLYVSWAGRAVPDGTSGNHTEALLADADFQRLFETVESEILRVVRREADDDPKGRLLSEGLEIFQIAFQRPAALFVGGVESSDNGLDLQMAFVVRMGEEATRGRRSLERMEQLVPRHEGTGAPQSSVPPLNALALPEGAPRIFYGFVGDDLVLAAGEETARSAMAALAGSAKTPAWLENARAALPVERPAMVTFLDVAGIRRTAAPFLGGRLEQMLRLTGLDAVSTVASVAGLEGDGFVQRSRITFDGEPQGLLSLIGDAALTPADLAAIPEDATFAVAGRLDPGAAYDRLREAIAQMDPGGRNDLSEMFGEIESELGIRLDADLFDTLGETWCLYNSPGDGGLLISGLTAVVKVDDRATLERTLNRFVETIRLEQGGGRRRVTIKDFFFEGQRVYFLNAIGEEMPVAPAWCITDDALVVAAYPQMIKSYLLRGPDSPTLADVPEIAALWQNETSPVSLSYADLASVFRTAYPVLHPIANLICAELQKEGLAIDISLLPAARSVLPHLTPATRTISRTEDGILVTTRGSLPIGGAGLGSAAPFLGMMFFGVRMHVAHDVSANVGVQQQELRATAELRNVGMALNLYEVEHAGLPDSLEALVEAGYLSELPKDPWGAPLEYYGAGADGDSGAAPSRPVAALSHPTPSGQRVVLYSDGRVETVPESVFQLQRGAE